MANVGRHISRTHLRTWTENTARPCSRCRADISQGESFTERVEGFRRLCQACSEQVAHLREVVSVTIHQQARQVDREHHAAVRFARMTTDLL
jgi:methylphosphotriester-DNA--protein-cysteine methyltransferase